MLINLEFSFASHILANPHDQNTQMIKKILVIEENTKEVIPHIKDVTNNRLIILSNTFLRS